MEEANKKALLRSPSDPPRNPFSNFLEISSSFNMRDSERGQIRTAKYFCAPNPCLLKNLADIYFYPETAELACFLTRGFNQGGETSRDFLLSVSHPCKSSDRFRSLFLQSNASALQAVHGRELPLHRRPEPHQLQHALRAEDAHDDLSRNGATRFHGHALDHCKLDAPTM